MILNAPLYPCEGLTGQPWSTMVQPWLAMLQQETLTMVTGNVNKVMPWHCIYAFNSNFLTKKCLKMSVGDLSYGSFCFSLINPITYGGGGFLARTIRLSTTTLKRLYLAPPNLVTFCFYLLDTLWQNFSKIDLPGGLLQLFLK